MQQPSRPPCTPRAAAAALAVAALLLGLAAGAPAADREAGRAKASMCVTCHGLDGVSRQPNSPHIAGQNEFYLREQLHGYRAGRRQHPQMNVIAQGLSDADIDDLAAWYAGIKVTVDCDCQ